MSSAETVKRWDDEFGGGAEYKLAVELMRSTRTVRRGISLILERHGLALSQWTIMTIVYFSEERSVQLGEIAELLSVHATTVSNAVDKLVAAGWMSREPRDRRTVLAVLTKEGQARLVEVQKDIVEANFGIMHLSSKKIDILLEALSNIRPSRK
jgi:DNA-binding MarR family transcriptional regulator